MERGTSGLPDVRDGRTGSPRDQPRLLPSRLGPRKGDHESVGSESGREGSERAREARKARFLVTFF